mgnify:CR=1 FL=1
MEIKNSKNPNKKNPLFHKWVQKITYIIRKSGKHSPAMSIPIYTLASTMMTLEVCNAIIGRINDNIEQYDSGELPSVFIRQKDAMNSCALQLKALLAVAGMSDSEHLQHPLMELLEKLSLNND